MSAPATPFDTEAPAKTVRPIIRYKPSEPGKKEMVGAHWGTNPRFTGGIEYRFVRSEGKTFPSHRCLLLASEFQIAVEDRRYRVVREDGEHFYLAGVWEPAMAGWPLAFRVITVAANREVGEYQERQGALIERGQVMAWLDGTVPEADLLVMPQAGLFHIAEISDAPVQTALVL